MTADPKPGAALTSDHAYQTHILQGVSRTFALTIPALPPELCGCLLYTSDAADE